MYVGNEKFVDSWIYNFGPDDHNFNEVSSKSLTSIMLALLVDRQLLYYEEKISYIWAEFC